MIYKLKPQRTANAVRASKKGVNLLYKCEAISE